MGAPGVVKGVIAAESAEYAPSPTTLRAATRKLYAMPFVSPVTVYDVDVDALLEVSVIQFEPPSAEY